MVNGTALGVAGLVVLGLGVVLIVVGTLLSLADHRRQEREAKAAAGAIETHAQSLGETLTGLAKLAEALKGYQLGMQLVFVGIVLIVLGGIIDGIGALAG